jgi:transcriptional regulator GlxA family with amidase domain
MSLPYGATDERIKIVCTYARMNLNQRLSLDHLARRVNLSRWALSHLFRQETGLSPMQWLKTQRITRAKLLLKDTLLTVKEVRAMVGAPDASHFAREFRRAFGLSPIQFRTYRTALDVTEAPRRFRSQEKPTNSKKRQQRRVDGSLNTR